MSSPTLVRRALELRAARADLGGRVAVVMTMGALHDGHAQLIRAAHDHADHVVVTIFVNPLQFGAGEDLDRYPRDLGADLDVCRAEDVDVVFAPGVEDVYPPGEVVEPVAAGALGDVLEGAVRPGHFDGVLTVVARLLELTCPDVAIFGEKDAQQLALIRRMVAGRSLLVEIIGVATVREPGGLAMSSRNRYLDDPERRTALAIPRALQAGAGQAAAGAAAVVAATAAALTVPGMRVDYVEVVDAESWQAPGPDTRDAVILVAARIGDTRLIDNMRVVLGTRDGLKE